MAISTSVRLALEKTGLSQKAMGEKIGRSRESVCAWKTGKTHPDFHDIEKMAAVCGVKPSRFVQWGE